MCFLATPFISCSGGPEAQLASLNVPCPAPSGVWSCGVEEDVQSSVAKLDGAGLYKPRDPVRNISLVCTLCHKPSLAWGSCHLVCPFKHSIRRIFCSGTQTVEGIFMLSEKECLHFVDVALKDFSTTLWPSDSLPPFQHAAFYHWAPPEA